MTQPAGRIAVTGANGYVGGCILRHLRAQGVDAIALVRQPRAEAASERHYSLGEPLDPGALDGVAVVVHAAYDASLIDPDAFAVNVEGSLPLLNGLHDQGATAILISSLSAFQGARSEYGRAKIALEQQVLSRKGVVLRPGLVFGKPAGGLFGTMASTLARRPFVPLPGGGMQRQFVTHDASLAELVYQIAVGQLPPATGRILAAHRRPLFLRDIIGQIVGAHGRNLRAVDVPIVPCYLAARSAERLGATLPFRSDSLLALMHPIPLDQIAELDPSPVQMPALDPELWFDPRTD